MKMNKRLFLLLVTASAFITTHAQIQLGVKAGPGFYSFSGSDAGGSRIQIGLNAAVFAKIPFSDQFSLQPEVQYSMQGAGTTEPSTGDKFNFHNNYINVPLMFTFTHSSGLILQTGPQVSFLMSSTVKGMGTSADSKDAFKSADVGWATGIGYLSPANIGFIFRYSAGWLNVENTNNAFNSGGSLHNVGFQLGVFYLFGDSGNN
jgi:hypothetical protein